MGKSTGGGNGRFADKMGDGSAWLVGCLVAEKQLGWLLHGLTARGAVTNLCISLCNQPKQPTSATEHPAFATNPPTYQPFNHALTPPAGAL
eukprot:345941-Chlamydomonas_euryale.AAC.2